MAVIPQFKEKDPADVEPYFFVWCDETGLNDGSADDYGALQGAEIASYVLTVEDGLTVEADNKSAVSIKGIDYPANCVVSIWLSGGTAEENYTVACKITTNENPARTIERTRIVPVRQL